MQSANLGHWVHFLQRYKRYAMNKVFHKLEDTFGGIMVSKLD